MLATEHGQVRFLISRDMPFLMPDSWGCGCQKVSKNLPGIKGGAALLGTHSRRCPQPVVVEVHTQLLIVASCIDKGCRPGSHLRALVREVHKLWRAYSKMLYDRGKGQGCSLFSPGKNLSRMYC